jgi:multicomponent Na+:H+ antiporter subunit A
MIAVFLAPFLLAPLLPLLDRWLGNKAAWLVACAPIAIGTYFSNVWRTLPASDDQVTESWSWVPELGLRLTLMLDGLSLLYVLMITAVGALVAIYASEYLAEHKQLGRFHVFMMLFMGAMLGIVVAGNLLVLYVCWELTSITSFLLIGFEHERSEARDAAKQALITTAAGGLCLLAGFVLLGLAANSFELSDILARGDHVRGHRYYPAIVTLVLLGAFTKSAQFPFHYWLPGAMEAPTPVSAYLHSATMVKAGIYLMARFTPTLGGTDLWAGSLTVVGGVTMFLGAYLALFEHDLKGVLAYLTINVLGTLTMLLGLGTPLAIKAAMVYMVAHALYKGALFLIAGIIDHATHSRDLRELRGLMRALPLTGVVALAAALSMAGIAPTFGFIAKELFLDAVWNAPFAADLLVVLSVVSSVLLVVGAGRVGVMPFVGHRAWRPDSGTVHPVTESVIGNARRQRGEEESGLADASGYDEEGLADASLGHGRGTSAEGQEIHAPGFVMQLAPLVLATAGVVIGLAPQSLISPIVAPALQPVASEHIELHLALWHGFTVPLALSITVLAAGGVGYVLRNGLQQRLRGTLKLARWGPARWYDAWLIGLNRVATWQTQILQPGRLPRYVLVTACVLLVLAVLGLIVRGRIDERLSWIGIRPHEAIAAVVVPAAAILAVLVRSRLASVAALGVVGYGVAWLFAVFGAPDLAATQIVIESLNVILFVLAFARLPRYTQVSSLVVRLRDIGVAASVGAVLTMLLVYATNEPHAPPISEWYARNSVSSGHGRNVVNVILVDFRSLDTLGEITVLATAAVGVWTLVRFNPAASREKESPL